MRLRNLIAASSVGVAMLLAGVAPASAKYLTFSVLSAGGNVTITPPGDITAGTLSKTLPPIEFVGTVTGAGAAANILNFQIFPVLQVTPVNFSTLTIPTANGPFALTLGAGNLTFSFTQVANVDIAATTAGHGGHINLDLLGTITGDTSVGQVFLHQDATYSEACTQTALGAVISCTETVATNPIPEPMSIALLGTGLLGAGAVARRRKAKKA